MKLRYYSIKLQIVVAFSLLALPIIALTYFFSLSYSIFDESLQQLMEIEDVTHTVGEIERNVIDLQRNALIFKETASASSEEKVNFYYSEIEKKISGVSSQHSLFEFEDELALMESHLEDYHENFTIVVSLRRERSVLINEHLNFATRLNRIFSANAAGADVYNALLIAHAASVSYLSAYDLKYFERFKQQLNIARERVKSASLDSETRTVWQREIADYRKRFVKIVAVTRHYVYLINVVITGSANEIIYYANYLHVRLAEKANLSRHQVNLRLDRQKMWIAVVSMFAIVMAAVSALLFYKRITQPIDRITQVFEKLAADESVKDIPESHRKDEIGMLASAADVFRAKNAQTNQLLLESKKMISDQKALNAELAIAKRHAEKALSIKSEFLANMSHELRTPLNSVIGYTVRLLKHVNSDRGIQLKALEAIERNGRHLLAMINDILDLSKIEAQKLDLSIRSVDLNELCEQAVTQVGPAAEEKNLEIVFIRSQTAEVQTDFTRLSQILLNLLSNAIKYTDEGGIKIELERDISEKYISLRVIDTGIGIEPENQKRLFLRFEQFDDSSRFQVGKGSGLGLAIVASLSKLLGVRVSVASDVGKGSTFSLRVPVVFAGDSSTAKN
ncbi:hybrid sensor histidine kinase/response regulator [Teredinibacter turnerae]|uniref:sensor histidine kinase n=1 Tax=Teredinibacter turnerae TaxID=2426 RepID=UPI0003768493|nr:hybrid sensor histidine kinase/response regulator [Teredinibacter turnerae]